MRQTPSIDQAKRQSKLDYMQVIMIKTVKQAYRIQVILYQYNRIDKQVDFKK